ncbi:hypothetical protein [Actinomadura rubrisoli]|uniref:Uncharacterized protein n=1 Tax=Actinomadura rubrisoli TaxID=2530368 RepID=A0A4R5AZK0_9ACTN|nr:hypothetical protein [Actinomadura rubrisoli]TDD79048.1 hypothetical protein E1298_28635 [Actinomadura rubrisoli]
MATTAPYYADGEWSSGPDLLMDSWEDGEEDAAPLGRLGYKLFTTIGYVDVPTGVGIAVYSRSEAPRFLVEVQGEQGGSEHIYAAQSHDALELLARYAPIAQAAAISSVVTLAYQADARGVENIGDLLRAINEAMR